MQSTSTTIKIAIEAIVAKFPKVHAIYRFGSYGSKYATTESDLDLAILTTNKIDNLELWQLAQEIARKIQCNVDLVHLNTASTVFSTQIIISGERIYGTESTDADMFETITLTDYLDLQQRRQELIQDIKQRGSIANG